MDKNKTLEELIIEAMVSDGLVESEIKVLGEDDNRYIRYFYWDSLRGKLSDQEIYRNHLEEQIIDEDEDCGRLYCYNIKP